MMDKKRVAVVGGGPAGMMAAKAAAQNGNHVTLFEKNEKLGKKLFLTGKGRCNITNDADISDFFSNIVRNSKFLYSALYSFTNVDLLNFFEKNGLRTKVERGGRVFPDSDKSSDVIKALQKSLREEKVKTSLNTSVISIEKKEEKFEINTTGGKRIFDAVIIATGGLSYPSTGSDGKFFDVVKSLGHTTTDFEPSLVSLNTNDKSKRPVGLTLKNIEAKYYNSGKMVLDLKPALDEKKLENRIIREINEKPNKDFSNLIRGYLPSTLVPHFIDRLSFGGETKGNTITKENRKEIIELLKNYRLDITSKRGINEAIITRGGVKTNEINPSTLESKIVNGVYFAGEVLDVDALTGGYNLQIAFSTGYLAGISV